MTSQSIREIPTSEPRLPARATIIAEIKRLLRESCRVDAEALGPATDLLADLQLDSVQRMTLVVELENRFEICFDAGDEAGLRTVSDVAERIEAHLGSEEPR
ncbi:MAG: acyl carrier protein [Proteobacteria bacterium]|nr:MAG: acyl carrier protein [Pseudomonadota bacterium]